jgi:hypothetical protein
MSAHGVPAGQPLVADTERWQLEREFVARLSVRAHAHKLLD